MEYDKLIDIGLNELYRHDDSNIVLVYETYNTIFVKYPDDFTEVRYILDNIINNAASKVVLIYISHKQLEIVKSYNTVLKFCIEYGAYY